MGSAYIPADTALTLEIKLVWEKAPREFDYVRETYLPTSTCYERPEAPSDDAHLIGYALHAPPEATNLEPGTTRERRLFFLQPDDRTLDPDGFYATRAPAGAVDPRTVEPGKPGQMTARARGDNSGESDD